MGMNVHIKVEVNLNSNVFVQNLYHTKNSTFTVYCF